jgi:peroxiredoxin
VAKYINRHFEEYIEGLKPPFFGRVIEFNESSSEVWTCPGHNGGMFYRKSPVGHIFYEYLGEAVFRTDLDNSVVELGDLLVHEGPAREAELAAAKIFGADRTYFVLNGTSTSSKIVTGALVSRGDLVLFDRRVRTAACVSSPTSSRNRQRHIDRDKEQAVRADIVPGGTFPDYELTDHAKTRHRLSELQGIDPMILLLSRGGYCPKDHQQHLELAANYPKIAVAYTKIVTISTDNILETNEFRASIGAQWTFLSDAGRHVQKDLGIAEYTDPHHDPMIPHTLVLKPGLVIYSVYNGYWFWGRPSFEDLRRDLREVTREVRPDWDLATPGLREAWEAGDPSKHYPYREASRGRQAG